MTRILTALSLLLPLPVIAQPSGPFNESPAYSKSSHEIGVPSSPDQHYHFPDGFELGWGSDTNNWLEYNDTAGQWEFWSSDVDGTGSDASLFHVPFGLRRLTMQADQYFSATGTATSGGAFDSYRKRFIASSFGDGTAIFHDTDTDFIDGIQSDTITRGNGSSASVELTASAVTFGSQTTLQTSNTEWADAHDIDGDGDIDLTSSPQGGNLLLWLNDGNGSFTSQTIESSLEILRHLMADYDGDGDIDIIASEDTGNRNVYLYANDGSENFTRSTVSTDADLSDSNSWVANFDADGDGDTDLVSTRPSSGTTLKLWTNDGTGSLTTSEIDPDGHQSVTPVDIDEDGDTDLVSGDQTNGNVVLYTNNGSGSFTPSIIFSTAHSAGETVADFDGDGDQDIIIGTSSGVTLLTNDGSENFTSSSILGTGSWSGVTSSDYDGDGDTDFAASDVSNDNTDYWTNDGSGSFTQDRFDSNDGYKRLLSPGDPGGDGDEDIVFVWPEDASNRQFGYWEQELSTFTSPGTHTSIGLDTGVEDPTYGDLSWTENLPTNTDLTIQLAHSDDNVTFSSFVGPDGTTSTSFTTASGEAVPASFDGQQYIKYELTLTTSDNTVTPSLDDITIALASALNETKRQVDIVNQGKVGARAPYAMAFVDDAGSVLYEIDQLGNIVPTVGTQIGTETNPWQRFYGDYLFLNDQSATIGDIPVGHTAMWQSDGSGTGNDGEILIKVRDSSGTQRLTRIPFPSSDTTLLEGTGSGSSGNIAEWDSSGQPTDSGLQSANTPQTDTANTFSAGQTFSAPVQLGEALADNIGLNGSITNDLSFEGLTADANEGTLDPGDPTLDHIWSFPDASGEISLLEQNIEDGEVDNTITTGPARTTETASDTDTGDTNLSSVTIDPITTQVELTVNDADGTNVTMGETNAANGDEVVIVNDSANTANFSDTAGVSELAGAFSAGQWDTLRLRYASDRWVEVSRSNN